MAVAAGRRGPAAQSNFLFKLERNGEDHSNNFQYRVDLLAGR